MTSPARTVLGGLGVAVAGTAAGLALWGVLRLGALDAPPAYCVAVGTTAIGLYVLARMVGEPLDQQRGPELPEPERRRELVELVRLEQQLSWGSLDPDRFESRIRPMLVRLSVERLRQRHGIDPAREPRRARAIVGEDLWRLMTDPGPVTRPVGRQAVTALVSRIESI